MIKTFKFLIKTLAILLVLFIVVSVAFTVLVDINQYKSEIIELVEQEAGLKLEINGEMKLTIFSGLKFNAENVKLSLGNELIADIQSLKIGMEAYSIYIGEPEVDSVELHVRTLNIFRDKNNQFNFLPLLNEKRQNNPVLETNKIKRVEKLALNYLALKDIKLSIEQFQYLDDLESISVKLNKVNASLSLLPIIDHSELVIDDPRVLVDYTYSGKLDIKQALINQYQISSLSLVFKDKKGDFVADELAFHFIQEGVEHTPPPLVFEAQGQASITVRYDIPKGATEPLWFKPDMIKIGKFDFKLPKLKVTQEQFRLETTQAKIDFEEVSVFDGKKYLLDNLQLKSMNFDSKKLNINLQDKGDYELNQLILILNNFPLIQKGKVIDMMSESFLREFSKKGQVNFSTGHLSHESHALKNLALILKGKNNRISLNKFSFNALESKMNGEGELIFYAKNKNKIPKWNSKFHSDKLNLQPFSEVMSLPSKLEGYASINTHLSGEYQDSKFTIDDGLVNTKVNNLLVKGINLDKVLEDFQSSQSVGLLDVGAVALLGPAGMLVTKGNDYHNLMNSLDNKGNSEVKQLNSEISFSDGVATLNDVAFATLKHRLALTGKINTNNNSFINFKVATIDKHGCPIYQEEVKGGLDSPKVKKVNVLVSGVINPINSILSKVKKPLNIYCKKPFYTGVVKAPIQ